MIWAYVAAGAAAVAIGFGSGWQVRDWKADADDLARVQGERKDAFRRAEIVDQAATAHEGTKAAAAARERIVIKEVERVVEKPVYRSVCLDDDGLRILAADIDARHPGGEPPPALPGFAEADREGRPGGADVEP